MAIFRGVGGSGDSSDNSFLDEVTAQAQAAEASATAAANSATSALNTELTSASFNTSNGVLTLTKQDGDTVTTDLDGRFLLTETDPVFSAHAASGVTSTKITNWDTSYNDKINAVSFSSSNNTLTLTQQDGSTLTTIINGSLTGGGETLAQTLAIGNTTGGNDISFGDNDKAKFGASDDLQIYHDGSNSYIKDGGTGNLRIIGDQVLIANASNNEFKAVFNSDGASELYHNGSKKIATTSTGIDVTGSVTNLNESAGSVLNFQQGGSGKAWIANRSYGFHDGNGLAINTTDANPIRFSTNNAERMRIDSAGNVGIGTTSPPYLLTTNYNANATFSNAASDFTQMWQNSGTNGLGVALADDSTARLVTNNGYALAFNNATSEAMRIDSSGNVGIGTTTPATALDISQSNARGAYLRSSTTGSRMHFLDATTSSITTVGIGAEGNNLVLHGGGAEFMRVASSGKVGIGTTSPSEQLHIYSAGHAKVEIEGGTDEDASLLLTETGSTGFRLTYDGGDNKLLIGSQIGGNFSTKVAVDRDSGKVGIGTTSPATDLHVKNTGATQLLIESGETSTGFLLFGDASDLNVGSVSYDHSDNSMRFETSDSERMRINSSGNVGIGTTSPAEKLEVQGRVVINNSYGYRIGATSTGDAHVGDLTNTQGVLTLRTEGNRNMRFDTAGSERMRISSTGNVGIGTDNPSADLHIKTDVTGSGVTPASDSGLFIDGQYSTALQLGAYWAGQTTINFGTGSGQGGSQTPLKGQIAYNNYSNYMAFRTNGTEKFRCTNNGQLLIGTTTTPISSIKLKVNGVAEVHRINTVDNGSTFVNGGYYATPAISVHSWTSNTSSPAQTLISFKNSGATQYGSITMQGTSVTYNTSSDERLKENIKDAEDAGDKIDAIKIRQFDWKEGGEHQDYGVIAQELDEVAPEAVTKGATKDDMMQVDYSKLVPTLIKEIQSLRNRVAELEKN